MALRTLVAEMKMLMQCWMQGWMFQLDVYISLGPATANDFLIFSNDPRSVRCGHVYIAVLTREPRDTHLYCLWTGFPPLWFLLPLLLGGGSGRGSWMSCGCMQGICILIRNFPCIFQPWLLGCKPRRQFWSPGVASLAEGGDFPGLEPENHFVL